MPVTIIPRRFLQFALLISFLLVTNFVNGQDYKRLTYTIDSLVKLNLPKSALVVTDKLDKLAKEQNNTAQHIKAVLYRMRFQSIMEDNAIVAVVNGLRQDIEQSSYPAKPVLQSLLANVYWMYYQRNRYTFMQRSHLEKAGNDFTLWDLQTINTEVDNLFKLSLQNTLKEQQTPVTVLDGVLDGDAGTRNLRPTLYDLLAQRALDFYLSDETRINKPKNPFGLYNTNYFGESRAFAVLEIPTNDTTSTFYKGIKLLQQITMFHLQRNEDEAVADLDLKRLEFMYSHASVNQKDQLYLDALAQIAGILANKPVSAEAIALQGKYYFDHDSLKRARDYFNKAAGAFAGSKGAQNATGYLNSIQQQELNFNLEEVNVPDKPLLGLMTYRNLKNVQLQLYKISTTTFNWVATIGLAGGYNNGSSLYRSDSVLNYLKTQKPVQVQSFNLPDPGDYKRHSTEFKIDALPIGTYIAILRDTTSANHNLLQLNTVKITHLAYVTRRQPDNSNVILVADRETGKPLSGVHVIIDKHNVNKFTDNNGICNLGPATSNAYSIKLTTKNDTLYTPSRYSYGVVPNTEKKPIHRTILFTDREIYRPGQTVYFKGIELQIENGKSSIQPNQHVTVTVKSGNKAFATIPVVTNEFGSFSGSFIMPQNILHGMVILSTGNNGSKYINVEEYKRPNFQVVFQPVTGTYKPNDSVTIKGTVTAYSGYGISQARVAYHINRQNTLSDFRLYAKYRTQMYSYTDLVTDTVKTDNQGQFQIKFKAIPGQVTNLKDFVFNFRIAADVNDGSGETRSANAMVAVGVNNISLLVDIPRKASVKDSVKAAVKINNLNGIAQNGQVKLSIYALKQPGVMFKARLWGSPDQYLMDSSSYKKDFPTDIYRDENLINKWPVSNKVTEVSASSDGKLPALFKLNAFKQLPSGSYKIVVQGKNATGDTTSVTQYLSFVNEPAIPANMGDWVMPLAPKPLPGLPMEFFVGTGIKGRVLVEKYSGPELLSSRWIEVPQGKQQLVKIPVTLDEENISVQFLTFSQNRIYSNYQRAAPAPDNKLDIKFFTFRDKLQPGEKEQWKLQITGKNKEAVSAEMMADMYDASLDAIASNNSWNINLNGTQYPPAYFGWNTEGANNIHTSFPYNYNNFYFNWLPKRYETLNLFGYDYYGGYNMGYQSALTKARALYKTDTVQYKAAAYQIRIDEPVGNSDANEIFTAVDNDRVVMRELTTKPGEKFSKEAIIRSTQEISALGNFEEQRIDGYGDQASGVRLQSITTRKNFNETAFFYPQLHTDEKGQVLVDFTIPESLTRWRFRAYVHTKDLQSGYAEQEIVTQKQLSVSANMPRFLRAGDTITVSARLANLTAEAVKGSVQLQLFNALNMQPVKLLLNGAEALQKFDLPAAGTKPVSFKMVIPAGLDALTYRITAAAGQYTDGEENTVPVLPNQMLVTEAMPMMVRPGQSKTFTFDKLVNQHSQTLKGKTLTLEYTQNPAWYAVQALPYT
jgi:hypothetical protein